MEELRVNIADKNALLKLGTTEKICLIRQISDNLVRAEKNSDMATKSFYERWLNGLTYPTEVQNVVVYLAKAGSNLKGNELIALTAVRMQLDELLEEDLVRYDAIFLKFLALRPDSRLK